MTSSEKLTLIRTVVEATDKHDFASPQVSVDSTCQRGKQETEAAHTYILQQAFPTVQNLVPLCNATAPSYTMRLDTVGSFLRPQPHMLITQDPGGFPVAEVKFHLRGYDATIVYRDTGASQKLALRDPQEQRFECLINEKPHWWHLLGPSKSVFELTDEAIKRVALFVYASSGNHIPFQQQKIGEVHVIDEELRGLSSLQQILFSVVVVVEQAKRRATSIASWVPPAPSKTHFPGRRRKGAGDG